MRPSHPRLPLLILGVILVLVAAVAVVGVVMSRDGSGADPEWNALVGVDPETGDVTLYDESGEEVGEVEHGLGEAIYAEGRGNYVVIGSAADSPAEIVDVTDGEIVWQGDADERVTWLRRTTAPIALIADLNGGEMTVIDAERGRSYDLADEAGLSEPTLLPHAVQISPDASILAAPSATGDESVVLDLEQGEVSLVAGRLGAVSDEGLLAIDQDDATRVVFLSTSGEERGTVQLPEGAAVRGLVMTGGTEAVGLVATDGVASVVDLVAGEEPDEVAEIDVRIGGARSYVDAERFLIEAEESSVLVDLEGEELASYDGSLVLAVHDFAHARCAAVSDDGEARIIDLDSGDELAAGSVGENTGFLVSADGCALSGIEGFVSPDRTEEVAMGEFATIAPDGRAAVVSGADGAQLLDLTRPDAEPLDLDLRVFGGYVQR